MTMKMYIYWTKKIRLYPEKERRIREYFGLGTYKSVNGETPLHEPTEAELDMLRKIESKGYIQIRVKEK